MNSRLEALAGAELDRRLLEDRVDVTLPGAPAPTDGPPASDHGDAP